MEKGKKEFEQVDIIKYLNKKENIDKGNIDKENIFNKLNINPTLKEWQILEKKIQ